MAAEAAKKIHSPPQSEGDTEHLDPVEVTKKADELLGERPRGDDHFPGDVNVTRISLVRDLPRRT